MDVIRVTNMNSGFLPLWSKIKPLMKTIPQIIKNPIVLLFIFLNGFKAIAQEETEPFLDDFRGTASVTHNGNSMVLFLFERTCTSNRFKIYEGEIKL